MNGAVFCRLARKVSFPEKMIADFSTRWKNNVRVTVYYSETLAL